MRRRTLGAVVSMALFAAGTVAAQPAKPPSPGGTAGSQGTAAASPKASGAPVAASPKASGAPVAGSAAPTATAAPLASGTAAPAGSAAPVATAQVATSAAAPDYPPKDASELFGMGREAFKAESYAPALDLFKKSYALEATPGTLLNIALTEEKLGKTASALQDFERVTGLFKPDDDRMPIAREGVARTTVRAPRLKIDRAAGAPPTLAIHVDGAPMAANLVGALQPLDPGKHTITTSVYGFEDRTYEVTLTEGQQLGVAVEPGKRTLVAAPVDTAKVAASAGMSGATVTSIVIWGAGVGGILVGATTGILATMKKSELDTACPDPAKCSGEGLRTLGAAYSLADIASGALVFGGAALAGGVTMFLVSGGLKSLFVTAAPTANGAALTATGRF